MATLLSERMRVRSLGLCALLAGLAVAGCATSGDGTRSSSTGPVTVEDIAEISASDAFEILQRLRPRWLQSRGQVSMNPSAGYPVVYVDGMRFGALDTLRQIDVYSVRRIEFIGASDATTRFGTGHTGGVIMVLTQR